MKGREDELACLLRAALKGDENAYDQFLRNVASLVRGYARRNIAYGSVDAEDIVQETLLAIHTKRHTWQPERPVLPWISAIARFKLIDAFRRVGQRTDIKLDDIMETVAAPEKEAAMAWEVTRVLDALTPGQRHVVLAISVEGNSIAQTAKNLEMSEAAVRVALHRGLAAISRKFGRV